MVTYDCAHQLPRAWTYADSIGGWKDGRLGQIFDLLESVRMDHGGNPDVASLITRLRDDVEHADCEIGSATA